MKTLVINGSPRKNGDTAALISELRRHLDGEIAEISAYRSKISPCIDCRRCFEIRGCVIRDDMDAIYSDDYDNLIIASPIHTSLLTGPVVSLASRFQCYYGAKRFQNAPIERRPKRGAVILVGGGDGAYTPALDFAKVMLRYMNASFDEQNFVLSHNTDNIPAADDSNALEKAREVAARLNMEEAL